MSTLYETLAEELRLAAESRRPCAPIRDRLGADLVGAYRVQDINTRHWITQGRRLVGRKIGLTAKVVQQQLGVDQPDYGMLYADMCIDDDATVPWSRTMQPKLEAEIAFVLDRDLDFEQPTYADILSAVAYATPAIEIVGSRIQNWDIRIVDTIADNASSGLFVLGTQRWRPDDLDLRLCGMVLEVDGRQATTGAGAACLGHPLAALAWLARQMLAVGRPLEAGDVVLSGALGPMVAVGPGVVAEARIGGLGRVRVAFGADARID